MAPFNYKALPVNKAAKGKPYRKSLKGQLELAGFKNMTPFTDADLRMIAEQWDVDNYPEVLGLLTEKRALSKKQENDLRLQHDPLRKQRQREQAERKAAKKDPMENMGKGKQNAKKMPPVISDSERSSANASDGTGKDLEEDDDSEDTPAAPEEEVEDYERGLRDRPRIGHDDVSPARRSEMLALVSKAGDVPITNNNEDDQAVDGEQESGGYIMGATSRAVGNLGNHKTDNWSMAPDSRFAHVNFTGILSGPDQVLRLEMARKRAEEEAQRQGRTSEPPKRKSVYDWRDNLSR
ncbi:hypothetical protein PTMSG1_00288 [Pyrenophora teres f. maculata]|nr:hypothetical protein PTMSG1_00288 [Pyrenophora teres f. maculata]